MANTLAVQMSGLGITAQASTSRPTTVRPWVVGPDIDFPACSPPRNLHCVASYSA